MAKVLIKALNKNELCKNEKLYTKDGLKCDLKIIAMTPAKDIKSKIKDALGLKNISNITIEIEKVVILGSRKKKDWDFKNDEDNLGQVLYRYDEECGEKTYTEEGPMNSDERLINSTNHAECLLRASQPNLRFEIRFK